MAGDAFKRVQPGQGLAIPAEAYNAFVDVAVAHRVGRDVSVNGKPIRRNYNEILIRNDTGAARDRFDVVGLGDPVVLPDDNLAEFKNTVVLKGLEPTADHVGKFALLQEPVPEDGFARALVAGVTPCRFTEDPDGSEIAGAEVSEFDLKPATGSAQILWAADAALEGVWWGLVRLPGGSGGGGVQVIRFEIWEQFGVDCEGCTAIAEVLSRPPGSSAVPGEFTIHQNQFGIHEPEFHSDGSRKMFVDVYDARGSFLNETNRDLVGRRGHAAYLTRDSRIPDLCEYLPDTRWEIISLDEQQDVC